MSQQEHFQTAVEAIFEDWTALQLAVKQGAGGPQSVAIAKWMVEATVKWFSENKDLEFYEVEDFLAEIIDHEFNLRIDDGSTSEISRLLCEFYTLSSSKTHEDELKKRLQALPKCDLSKCRIEESNYVDEDEMQTETSERHDTIANGMNQMSLDDDQETTTESVQDPDGWTVVARKKK